MHSYFKKIVGLFFGTLFSLTAFMSVNYFKNEESISDSFTPALAASLTPSSSYDLRGGVSILPLSENTPDGSTNYGQIDIYGLAGGNENWGSRSDYLYFRIRNQSSKLVDGVSTTAAITFRIWFDDVKSGNPLVSPVADDVAFFNANGSAYTGEIPTSVPRDPGHITLPAMFNGFIRFRYSNFVQTFDSSKSISVTTFDFSEMYKATLVFDTKYYNNAHINIGDIFCTDHVIYDNSTIAYSQWKNIYKTTDATAQAWWSVNRLPMVKGGVSGGINMVINHNESITDATPYCNVKVPNIDTSSGIYFYLQMNATTTDNAIRITFKDNNNNRVSAKLGKPIYLFYPDGSLEKHYVYHVNNVPGYITLVNGSQSFTGYVYIPYGSMQTQLEGSTFDFSKVRNVCFSVSQKWCDLNISVGDIRTVDDQDCYVGSNISSSEFSSKYSKDSGSTMTVTRVDGYKGQTSTTTKNDCYIFLIDQVNFTHSNNGTPRVRAFNLKYVADVHYTNNSTADLAKYAEDHSNTHIVDSGVVLFDLTHESESSPNWYVSIPWFIKSFDYIYQTTKDYYGKVDGTSNIVVSDYSSTGVYFNDYAYNWPDGSNTVKISHTTYRNDHSTTVSKYNTSVSANFGGTATANYSGLLLEYTKITITATPYSSYNFASWNDSSTTASRTIYVTSTYNYVASFTKKTNTITYKRNDETGNTKDVTKEYDVSYTIASLSDLEWTDSHARRFVRWDTNQDGSGTSYDPNDIYNANANLTLWSQQRWLGMQYSIDSGAHWYDLTQSFPSQSGVVTQYAVTSNIRLNTGTVIQFRMKDTVEGTYPDIDGTVTYTNNYSSSVINTIEGKFYLKLNTSGNYECYVEGYSEYSLEVIHGGTSTYYELSYDGAGQWVSILDVSIQSGDFVKPRRYNGSYWPDWDGQNISVNSFSQGNWTITNNGVRCDYTGSYKIYLQKANEKFTIFYFQLQAQASAKFFAQLFNSSIGEVCTGIVAGTQGIAELQTAWGTTKETGIYKSFDLLSDGAKDYLVPSSGDSDIQAFFIKYNYVINKYPDDLPDFLGDLNTLSAPKVTGKTSLFETENENKQLTTIIIVASLFSIVAISTLTLLAFKKGKNTKK